MFPLPLGFGLRRSMKVANVLSNQVKNPFDSRNRQIRGRRFFSEGRYVSNKDVKSYLDEKIRENGSSAPFLQSTDINQNVSISLIKSTITKMKQNLNSNNFKDAGLNRLVSKKNIAQQKLHTLEQDLIERMEGPTDVNCQLTDFFTPQLDTFAACMKEIVHETFPAAISKQYGLVSQMDQANYVIEKLFSQRLVPDFITSAPAQKLTVDISNPSEWYPKARKIRRKIIMHVGPTNSGKTYNALQRIKTAKTGYYAGPLRLLAREVYERFQAEGIRCNLATGEEIIQDLDGYGNPAGIDSGTIEMISTNVEYEVVILDEIQMIADEFRGWAWTHALLGVQAREIHLCGEVSAVPLIKKLAEITGDEVVVNEYKRLGHLEVERKHLVDGLKSLKKGDCIVAFSKNKILEYKALIETRTNLKCGVVYGALPPETRSIEAYKFNTGKYDVLVASDAIGMGLNLKINRVIFHSNMKFNGSEMERLTHSQAKQIAGRAGRFKAAPTEKSLGREKKQPEDVKNLLQKIHEDADSDPNLTPDMLKPSKDSEFATSDPSIGYVSAFHRDVLKEVKESVDHPIEYLPAASLWPPENIWAQYISEFPPNTPLTSVLNTFEQEVKETKLYKISNLVPRLEIADFFQDAPNLLIGDQLTLSTAPVSARANVLMELAFNGFIKTILNSETKSILDYEFLPFHLFKQEPSFGDLDVLKQLEDLHKVLTLFLWLGYRYPTFFVDRESATNVKELCEERISVELQNLKLTQQVSGSYKKNKYRR